MARYFLDSSALVKRYHVESGSTDIDSLFAKPEHRLFISRLALVEVQSSFARLVREKVLSEAALQALITRLDDDVRTGAFVVVAVNSSRLDGAANLLHTHGLAFNVRTLDAIHLATALVLFERRRLAGFVAADRKLLAIAEHACGLPVMPVG